MDEIQRMAQGDERIYEAVGNLEPAFAAALWAYISGLFDAPDLQGLRTVALDVRRVIPGSTAFFTEVDLVSGAVFTISDPPSASAPDKVAAYMSLRHESPVVQRFGQTDGYVEPLAISDLVDERSFAQTTLYTEAFRAVGQRDQLALRVPLCRAMTRVSLSVGRDGWGFTAAEHVAAYVIQRSLRATYGALWQRGSVRTAKGAASSLLARSGVDVCAVGRFGEIVGLDGDTVTLDPLISNAISAAGRLASSTRAGVGTGGNATAQEPGRAVAELAIRDSSGAPVSVQLLASTDGEFWPVTLKRTCPTITIEGLTACGLTQRQAQVMAHLLDGRTTAAAALEMGISPRTAEKHVYAACEALGYHRRTDALIALASGTASAPPRPALLAGATRDR